MMYAQPKGTFYVQLEDDIQTKKGYIATMKKFALQKTSEKKNWFVLDFCQLGFIGGLEWLFFFLSVIYVGLILFFSYLKDLWWITIWYTTFEDLIVNMYSYSDVFDKSFCVCF